MEKESIFAVLKGHIVATLPNVDIQTIDINKSMKDYGANSIDRSEIVFLTMDSLNISIPLSSLANINNIHSLIDLFYQHANK